MPKALTIEELEMRISEKNPKLTIDRSTYKNTSEKCRMYEEGYGEFWVRPQLILHNKQKGHPNAGKARQEATCLARYGSTSFVGSEQGRAMTVATQAAQPGGHQMRNPEVIEKLKKTNLEKYGFEYGVQSQSVKDKTKATNLNRYGTVAPLQNPDILAKQRATNMERYGGTSSMHSEEVYRKNLKANRDITLLKHWESGEEIVCRASYEVAVINYWNSNKIKYVWQVRIQLPSGKLYICDAYLPEFDKYVEIKGYWRDDAKEKWDEFSALYQNSEVWDRKKLKSMKLLK